MDLRPTLKTSATGKAKSGSGWVTTVIVVLLLVIAVMVIRTGKRFLETQQTTVEEQDIKSFSEYVNKNPDSIQARLSLAYSFQKSERYDDAREQYLEVLSIEPKNQGAMFNMGEIARINKDYPEAEKRLKELMQTHKYHVLGSVSLAKVYIETKKYDEAAKVMDEMIKGVPHVYDFYLVKADALTKKGDKAKAIETYKQVLRYDPENSIAKEALTKLK